MLRFSWIFRHSCVVSALNVIASWTCYCLIFRKYNYFSPSFEAAKSSKAWWCAGSGFTVYGLQYWLKKLRQVCNLMLAKHLLQRSTQPCMTVRQTWSLEIMRIFVRMIYISIEDVMLTVGVLNELKYKIYRYGTQCSQDSQAFKVRCDQISCSLLVPVQSFRT